MLSAVRFRFWTICAVLAGLPSLVLSGSDLGAIIRFNTTCAQCHEGQCSGRLSFTLGAEAAFDHIRRYAGNVDDALAKKLYDALSRMKMTCAFAPLPALSLRAEVTSGLDRYRNPDTDAYFVPVGILQPEQYRLAIHTEVPSPFRLEIISEYFELVEETCVGANAEMTVLRFNVDEKAHHYIRLRAPQALRLKSLGFLRE